MAHWLRRFVLLPTKNGLPLCSARDADFQGRSCNSHDHTGGIVQDTFLSNDYVNTKSLILKVFFKIKRLACRLQLPVQV
jgi:hypothetical protein